jgi:hypothetical protein
MGTVCTTKRTAPFAFVSVQAGLGSPALMSIVPVGGFEVKVKQVLLQPASGVANSGDAQSRKVQTSRQRDGVFSAKVSAIRHPRTGGTSRKHIFYAELAAPGSVKCLPCLGKSRDHDLGAQNRRSDGERFHSGRKDGPNSQFLGAKPRRRCTVHLYGRLL